MANIPTLQQLYDDFIADFETEYGITISPFGKSFLRADSGTEAAMLKLFYLALGLLQKNIWVDTADPVSAGGTLERFGYTKLLRYPFPATQGKYTCSVIGTAGAVIPALTQFKSDDSSLNPGFLFILDTAYTLIGTGDLITLRALTAGTGSILAISNTLTSVTPIINVNSVVTVTAITTDPIDAETTEEYRAKAEQAYRLSPQGGAPADYVLWGSDAAGVRKIYPYIATTDELNVYVEALLPDSVGPPHKGVPTSTILTDVTNDIETDPNTGIGRRPLGTFLVNVIAISPQNVDITIDSGGTITVDQQAIITAALTESIYQIRPFIAGVDTVASRNDTISVFGVGTTIIHAVGSVIISTITLDVAGSPVTSYLFDNGLIPYLNSVTYI